MDDEKDVTVSLELVDGYRFQVDFHQPGVAPLLMDEPAPLGEGAGPNAARVLAAAIGNCLSASALFCLRKARVQVEAMRADVRASLARSQRGRLRLEKVEVELHPKIAPADRERIGRCLEVFEDYCVVTQSVRGGIEVSVDVLPDLSGGKTNAA